MIKENTRNQLTADNKEALDLFGSLVLEARNSGLFCLKEYIYGKRLKNSSINLDLINSLSEEQIIFLIEIGNLILDTSFLKLFTSLEDGFESSSFSLNMTIHNKIYKLICEEEDFDIKHEYFKWISIDN